MNVLMHPPISTARKSLVTKATLVRSLARMDPLMSLQTEGIGKELFTLFALLLLPPMDLQVELVVGLLSEPKATVVTHEVIVFDVNAPNVLLQIILVWEILPAVVTSGSWDVQLGGMMTLVVILEILMA